MSQIRKIVLIVSILTFCSLSAAIEREMDEKNPIEITFSKISHNRIAIDGATVEKIIGDSSLFSVTLDKCTGQAFINVLQDIFKPVTLTVVTSSGLVQDLTVLAKDCPSAQLILRETEESDWDLTRIHSEIIQEASVIEMLNKILEGKIPLGYGQRSFEEEESLELPQPLKSEVLRILEGALETIFVYRITNESQQTSVITSDSLKREDRSWVFLNAHSLSAKQEALCIIGYPKDGN